MATTTLVPDGTEQVGAWTDEAGGTTDLHLEVDELTADTSYIRTATNGAPLGGSELLLALSAVPGDFTTATAATLNIRHSRGSVEGGSAGAGDDTHTLQASIHHPTLGNFVNIFTVETSTQGWAVKTENIGMSLTAAGLAATAADWNSARVMLGDSFSQSMGNDGHRVWVDFVNVTLTYTPAVALDQAGYRWRNDDGNETTATWKAAENVTPLGLPLDTNIRLRFVVENDDATNSVDNALQLQYRKNSGTWQNVTGSSSNVRSSASANLADNAATTRQLSSGTGTFTAGIFDEVDGSTPSTFDLPAGNLTELEFCLQLRSAEIVLNDVVELRVGNAAAGPFTGAYDHTPSITLPASIPKFEPFGENRHGPVRSSAGNYYYALRGEIVIGGTRDVRIWKSTDGGTSWVLIHVFEGLDGADIREVAVYGDGSDILHIFWHSTTSSDDHYYYAAWDMGDDTQQVAVEEAFSHTSSIDSFQTLNDVTARSDGTVVVVYALNTPDEVFTRRRAGGTWQSAQLLDTDFTTPHAPALVLDPATDNVHFFWHGWTSGGSGIKHRVLRASDNSLSTTDVITTTGTDQQRVGGCGIASGRLFVVQISATGDDITAWHSDSVAEAPTWASTSFAQGIVENDAADTARSYAMHSGGGRVAVAWALQSDFTIHYRQWDEDAVGWAAQVNPGHTVLDGAIITAKLTHDGANVTLWVSSRSTSVTNTSGPVIRSYNLGAVIEDDPDVDVALVTTDFYLDAAPLTVEASSSVTAKTADAAVDASQLQAGISATVTLVTADAAVDATPKQQSASSSPIASTADAAVDATPKAVQASSSLLAVTADAAIDATPKTVIASSSPLARTADAIVDATPQAQQASSAPLAITADTVIDSPPLAVQSDEPISFSGELVTADLYLEAAPLTQQASSSATTITGDTVVDATPKAAEASSTATLVAANIVVDGPPLAATTEQVIAVELVTADVVIAGQPGMVEASTATTARTADLVVDASALQVSAEVTVSVTLSTGDIVLDAPTATLATSGAPELTAADIYLDSPELGLAASQTLLAITGDYYIDSASGLGLSFLLLRREEGRARIGAYSGRIKGEQIETASLVRGDRQEGKIT